MALVIKKVIDLSSLGVEYKDIEITFKSIPATNLPELYKEAEGKPDVDFIPVAAKALQEYFISGKQGETELTKEDVGQLDAKALLHCFSILTGQTLDPKVSGLSTSSSGTEPEPAQT